MVHKFTVTVVRQNYYIKGGGKAPGMNYTAHHYDTRKEADKHAKYIRQHNRTEYNKKRGIKTKTHVEVKT